MAQNCIADFCMEDVMFVLRRTLKEVKLFQSYFVTYFIVLLIPFIAFWGIYVNRRKPSAKAGIENEKPYSSGTNHQHFGYPLQKKWKALASS